ncbi:MAG: hypothetical protein QXP13_06100 [Candidatus Methanomethylicia archaeon]
MQFTNSERIIQDARNRKLRNDFTDFVRHLLKKVKDGSYIIKFKKVLSSWARYNDISIDLKSVKIRYGFRNPIIENKRVLSQEELPKIIRSAFLKSRVSVVLMASSELIIEPIGNFKGND